MSDANRHWFYGPLRPMEPDPWHDRKRRLGPLDYAALAAIVFALLVWTMGDLL